MLLYIIQILIGQLIHFSPPAYVITRTPELLLIYVCRGSWGKSTSNLNRSRSTIFSKSSVGILKTTHQHVLTFLKKRFFVCLRFEDVYDHQTRNFWPLLANFTLLLPRCSIRHLGDGAIGYQQLKLCGCPYCFREGVCHGKSL